MADDNARELYERAIADPRHEFGSFFLSRLFGMAINYGEDWCEVSFEVVEPLFNPQGSLHGGVLATALDISMGHLLNRRAGPGATLEMKVQYFAPVRAGRVQCRARFLKLGRKLFFLQSEATANGGDTIAHATSTWKLL